MEKHLLALWQSIPSGEVKQEELAELLQLSVRQTTRSIKKWVEQGWFSYESGRGRGNASQLKWLKNVEEYYEELLNDMIDAEGIEKSSKYLLYDWSSTSKERIVKKFQSKFGYVQSTTEHDKLIIPRRYPLLTMHPLETAEVHGASIAANVFNRLVAVDANGIIAPELAHSWDLFPEKLRLYLKKDVKFHDGSTMTADDVVECLIRLKNHAHYKELWQPIANIESPAPLVVDLHHPQGCSYCLQMLGMINSSIYKEVEGQLSGTGGFYVEGGHKNKTKLVAFKEHFRERPLLDAVEFVVVPEDVDFAYRSAAEEKPNATFQVESDSGFGVVIMNAFRQTDISRKEVRAFLHYIIAKHRHEIDRLEANVSPNHKSCLAGHDQKYVPPKIGRPNFEKPLVLKTTGYVKTISDWLESVFEKEGVPFEVLHLPFKDYTFDDRQNNQADLFIHGEVFEMNQNFSFYHFLTNGQSPLARVLQENEQLSRYLKDYAQTPFEQWTALNLKVEKSLMESSVVVPLYYVKRQIPFSIDLANVNISHFGYADFSKLWLRPRLD
ncbi:ABC transporter substrate-binding protein [Planococcus sp. YIM B11945]|uniref:ABC transporter substrate-binding protein n=1 Tax=Planococcus sp. YIM B11945 TaxID=3435410 RepID=UPI003D7E0C19